MRPIGFRQAIAGSNIGAILGIILSTSFGCDATWNLKDSSTSPDRSCRLQISTREVMFESRLRIVLLENGRKTYLYSSDGEWFISTTLTKWSSDSARVAVLVCQGPSPRYFGYDRGLGRTLDREESLLALAEACGVQPESAARAEPMFRRVCLREEDRSAGYLWQPLPENFRFVVP